MDVAALLAEMYGRILPLAEQAVDGLDLDQLVTPPGPSANPVAWLVWHTARVQDHHIAELMDTSQIWVTGDWAVRFGLEPDPTNTGYGHTAAEVAHVRPADTDVLTDYLEAVGRRTESMLATLTPAGLDDVVDDRWDPPVTRGVRLVSVVDDSVQHLGQAAYVRGLLS